MRWSLILILAFLAGPLAVLARGEAGAGGSWRTASRESAGLAPDPATTPEAVLQVYAARAYGWRGAFGVHSWIAAKPAGAAAYTVYQVVGWREFRGLPVVSAEPDVPDRLWYGNRPRVLLDRRGPEAARLIEKVETAVTAYPYRDDYAMWPGPNSNTFTAFVARRVPELGLDLPVTAIGKDYLSNGSLIARAPSGTGWQLSLFGLAGVMLAEREGLEINVLGLVFGVDPLRLALKVPGLGRIGGDGATARAAGAGASADAP